jgi:hypothetical protein
MMGCYEKNPSHFSWERSALTCVSFPLHISVQDARLHVNGTFKVVSGFWSGGMCTMSWETSRIYQCLST